MNLIEPVDSTLTPFFSPKGIAIIGASNDPVKLGYALARNLVHSNYPGVVHFVNPRGGSLLGKPMVPNLQAIPDPVDLAIVLIPAPAVPQALQECGQRGIHAVILASGGFRETGSEGAALEIACLAVARQYNIRLFGPNCIGLLDTHLPVDTTFLPPPGPPPGDVAFISHSGAICAAVIDWARGQGFGLSRLVSLGNQADVNETDVLAPVAADPFTRVLTLYLEGVSDGKRFVAEAGRIARYKPIVALKVGRYASGQRAVASHTGALAGQENAFTAAFRRAGVIRADTSEELFDWARALAWCPPLRGRAIAVLTNAGGPGVTAADAIEAHHLHLAELRQETRTALQSLLPPAASLHNPVDMLASATPEQYASCLRILLADPGVDGVMVILPPPPIQTAGAVAKALIPVIHLAEKPVTIALMGERLIQEAIEHFRAARIPEYRFPERAASALAILADRAEYLARSAGYDERSRSSTPLLKIERLSELIRAVKTRQDLGAEWLDNATTAEILEAYGITVHQTRFARNATEACKIAEQIGFPVAVKIVSPDLPHKSDVGGVLLDLDTSEAVAQGCAVILERVRTIRPDARLEGFNIQPMLLPGQDVIIGAVQDAQFGGLVMFGSGGVEVEGLHDVAFGLAPLNHADALWMIENTWAGRKLRGYRHIPPADLDSVVDALQRLAQITIDFPQISEIEVNPLRALTTKQGAVALDYRARLSVI